MTLSVPPKAKTRPRPMRKNSASGLSVNLNPEKLECLLLALCALSDNSDLAAMASMFEGLAVRYRKQGRQGCQAELLNVVALLSSSLSTLPDLSTLMVYDIHSQIGLIREFQKGPSSAIQPYLKAFWIASATEDISEEILAITLHRLGRVYGASGNCLQGKSLLLKAIQIYEKKNLFKEPCMAEAKETLVEYEVVIKAESRSSLSMSGIRRLSLIVEEQEICERRVSF